MDLGVSEIWQRILEVIYKLFDRITTRLLSTPLRVICYFIIWLHLPILCLHPSLSSYNLLYYPLTLPLNCLFCYYLYSGLPPLLFTTLLVNPLTTYYRLLYLFALLSHVLRYFFQPCKSSNYLFSFVCYCVTSEYVKL